jgi:transcriptional regulator with XRE-family HTH domain
VVCNLRDRAGFSIQDLAPRAGLTPVRLAAIERDRAGAVSREEIEALARVVLHRLLIVGLEGL